MFVRLLKRTWFFKKAEKIKDIFLLLLNQISGRLDDVQKKQNALTANDNSVLQALVYLVEGTQQLRESNKRHDDCIQELTQRLADLTRQVQESFRQQTEQSKLIVGTEQYDLLNPEIGLIQHLYSYLPTHKALDIGANVGEVSQRLLEAGYEVYAFEPSPETYDRLYERLGQRTNFHAYKLAIGANDCTMDLNLADDFSSSKIYKDATLFSSLTAHSMPEDLRFTSAVPVSVRSLESLRRAREIPTDVSLVKIDAEGFDCEVIRGMGKQRYPVVAAEFWDPEIEFAKSGAHNRLEDLVREMKEREYNWHIVIYRVWGKYQTSFYSNYMKSVERSWGNVFFFQDYALFAEAQRWCSAVLPPTYFKPVQDAARIEDALPSTLGRQNHQ